MPGEVWSSVQSAWVCPGTLLSCPMTTEFLGAEVWSKLGKWDWLTIRCKILVQSLELDDSWTRELRNWDWESIVFLCGITLWSERCPGPNQDTPNNELIPVAISKGIWTIVRFGPPKPHCLKEPTLTVPSIRACLRIPQWDCHNNAVEIILGLEPWRTFELQMRGQRAGSWLVMQGPHSKAYQIALD